MLKREVRLQLENSENLPTLPAVAVHLLSLIGKPGVSIPELAGVLKADPALSAKVLKVVNSPLYSLRRKVMSLNHAISLLGLHAVETLALSFSLAQTMRNLNGPGFDRVHYWKRSVLSAAAAQELGTALKIPGSEALFMGGLLQDIGMLALGEVFPEQYSRVAGMAQGDHERLVTLENAVFGGDHAEVGGWLVKHWHFPEMLQEMVADSHRQACPSEPGEMADIVSCVALSGWIAEIWASPEREGITQQAAALASRLLDFDDTALAALLDRMGEVLPEVSELFEVRLQGKAETLRLLHQAKEALFLLSLKSVAQMQDAIAEMGALRNEVSELKARSQRDSLTGLYNREMLQAVLEDEIIRATQLRTPLTLIVCDIDHFKDFNDTYGHVAGDAVLQAVASKVSRGLRSTDQAFRYGGEEFVLLLKDTAAKQAFIVCERLRKSIESHQVLLDSGKAVSVESSFGYATLSDVAPLDQPSVLFQSADRALYAAKEAGRNRTVCYHDLPEEG